jgi:hypothetical protein
MLVSWERERKNRWRRKRGESLMMESGERERCGMRVKDLERGKIWRFGVKDFDVAKRLEKIQRDFLWGGMNEEFKYHLVEWDKVCTPIDEGGLGIRNIRRFNQALLGKWLWRFAHEEGAWWRSVLVAKYGSDWGGWRSGVISGSHGVGLWKYICMGWQNFRRFFKYDVGEGSKVRF